MAQSKKPKATYNIDEKVLFAFNELAEKNSLNKSKWVENKMREYLKEHEIEVGEN